MASPQPDDGYTKIAHELMEALIRAPLGGCALSIAFLILRESYGWGGRKETGPMGMKMIARKINRPRSSAQRGVQELMAAGIVIRTQHEGGAGVWSVVKDYDKWGDAPASPGVVDNLWISTKEGDAPASRGGRSSVPLGDAPASRGGRYSVQKGAYYKVLKESLKKRKKTSGLKTAELSTIVDNLGITPKTASEMLAIKFPFGTGWKGREIGDLPVTDCKWILEKWPNLTLNLKQGLELNIKMAEFDKKRRART